MAEPNYEALDEVQKRSACLCEGADERRRQINERWDRTEKVIRLVVKIAFIPVILAFAYFILFAPPEIQAFFIPWNNL